MPEQRVAGAPDDVARFLETLAVHRDLFSPDAPLLVTRAPGRLDVMGGIADYSGSLVLELPLSDATLVAAQPSHDGAITMRTLLADPGSDATVSVPVDALFAGGTPLEYPAARVLLTGNPRRRWAAYVAGELIVLARDHGVHCARGMRLLIDSSVPLGKGVASSAALEVASMQAICAACGFSATERDLAIACQRVENLVVGVPCGVMDQMTSACGQAGRLLALRCQPAELLGQVRVPAGVEFWGIDSGIRHEVGGAEYGDVRVAAFMGYRIVADVAGLRVTPESTPGRVHIEDPRWRGYLANVTPAEWERTYRDRVPERLAGREFLARYSGITDSTTSVDPARTYAVRQATAHPIYENHRVGAFRDLLDIARSDPAQLGQLMYQSHASYGACGLGSSGTDRIVEMVRATELRARGERLFGAKITGGGSGGVVAVLARAGSRAAVEEIARRYANESGRPAAVRMDCPCGSDRPSRTR